MDFSCGYWQRLLDPESYDVCGINGPQCTFVSSHVLYGLKTPQYTSNRKYSAFRQIKRCYQSLDRRR